MDLLTQSREESLHTPGRPTRSHEDHRRILEAVRRRDEVAAHRAMLDHLIAVETLVTGAHADDRSATPVAAQEKAAPPDPSVSACLATLIVDISGRAPYHG